jgi:hypothetical protein
MQGRDEQVQQADAGLFGDVLGTGLGIFGGAFNSAVCVVDDLIGALGGGNNPQCEGKGTATIKSSSSSSSSSNTNTDTNTDTNSNSNSNSNNNDNSSSTAYNYNYTTNKDGTLKVVITLSRGGSCTYNVDANGKQISDVVSSKAQQCLDSN